MFIKFFFILFFIIMAASIIIPVMSAFSGKKRKEDSSPNHSSGCDLNNDSHYSNSHDNAVELVNPTTGCSMTDGGMFDSSGTSLGMSKDDY